MITDKGTDLQVIYCATTFLISFKKTQRTAATYFLGTCSLFGKQFSEIIFICKDYHVTEAVICCSMVCFF